MIPFQAAGANTAIIDACDLGKALIQAHRNGDDFASVVPAYNQIMCPKGRERVLASRKAGEDSEDPVATWAATFKKVKDT